MSEEKFTEIADVAVAKAESIDCPLEEFRDGLLAMAAVIQERIEQVNDELGE